MQLLYAVPSTGCRDCDIEQNTVPASGSLEAGPGSSTRKQPVTRQNRVQGTQRRSTSPTFSAWEFCGYEILDSFTCKNRFGYIANSPRIGCAVGPPQAEGCPVNDSDATRSHALAKEHPQGTAISVRCRGTLGSSVIVTRT